MIVLPTAAEVLIVSCETMISLPIHFELKQEILSDRLPTMIEGFGLCILSRSELLAQSRLQLQTILTDFKQHFKRNYFFSSLLDLNAVSLESDCKIATKYLFCELSDFKQFIGGYTSVNEFTEKILDRHLLLVDFTLKNLDKLRRFSDYLSELDSMQITEEIYLTWIAALPRSIVTLVFRVICLSLLKYEMPLLQF